MRYAVTAFGLVLLGLCSVAGAQTFSQIYNFQGGSDGGNPYAGVTRDAAGNLYGTTYSDGNFNCPNGGCGVVYKIDPQGNEIPLYSFTGTPDGANPVAGVVADAKGNLYGTTKFGGAKGYGTVYEVSPSGAEKILVSFTGGADGGIPNGGLVMDKGGNLYGTTFDGGSAGFGTVFKLSAWARSQRSIAFRIWHTGCTPTRRCFWTTRVISTALRNTAECPIAERCSSWIPQAGSRCYTVFRVRTARIPKRPW